MEQFFEGFEKKAVSYDMIHRAMQNRTVRNAGLGPVRGAISKLKMKFNDRKAGFAKSFEAGTEGKLSDKNWSGKNPIGRDMVKGFNKRTKNISKEEGKRLLKANKG